MTEKETIVLMLEKVVEKTWEHEKRMHKALFDKELKPDASICQGLTRQIKHSLGDMFDSVFWLDFRVGEKRHLILLVQFENKKWLIDGTIKQFLPKENRTIFSVTDYPFPLADCKEWKL